MKYVNRNFEVYDSELARTIKVEVYEDGLIKITDNTMVKGQKEIAGEFILDRETGELFAKALTEFCAIDENFE